MNTESSEDTKRDPAPPLEVVIGLEGDEVAIGVAEISGDSSVGSKGRGSACGRLGGSSANEISAGRNCEAGPAGGVESEKSETWNDTVCGCIQFANESDVSYNPCISKLEL